MAIFSNLTEKLQHAFAGLRKKGKLSEDDVKAALKEVQIALLEADVNYKVVKQFIKDLREKSIGKDILESLTPAQQVIKLVNEELTKLMGGEKSSITLASTAPTVIMMCGLQGAGKSTTCAKLANHFKSQNRKVLLAACDIYRPAAIKQLQVLGESLEIPVFTLGENTNPVDIAKGAVEKAKKSALDIVIIDTAGRLHLDVEMMNELVEIKKAVHPHEILLAVDAMTGQDALNVAETFDKELGINGILMTKMDGDARGGAAISAKAVTGKPIKFMGTGEKITDLEVFHPERMASRILGMGDVLTLIEKAQENFDEKKALELEEKIRNSTFTLDDFLEQMESMKNMGSMEDIMGMIPGMNKQMKNVQVDERQMVRNKAIIQSMTKEERNDPQMINASRRKRIARGSGTSVQQVNVLLKQFKETQKMMKRIGQMGKGKMPKIPGLF
ncbi:signal recognition particle protein [Clostridia bacterium]|nr:signal recognition particle protein [Clostridia bacterium]